MSARKPREPTVASNEARIVRLETVIENIFSILTRMDRKFDSLELEMKQGFKEIDSRFKEVDSRFRASDDRQWSNFLWLMSMMIGLAGLMLTLTIGLASLIAHCQHWI